ncbi:MAG: hypothetical protein UV74_C0013G0213 [Candidatus Woesebacteria bacterium GW2011_GWB1_43_14]|uniref:Uncharacterized protein n=1 Tax=Candidatus Woesebacteria bacterium GW2011_GWB1_43_14 TaxID=1618578 RepID=A0A0G1FQ05_9BACT|nr:MAG: hypothetical protein UT21_C0005G0008 [Candidatus Woesebacteria bacterium GW2011_GWA1_39_11b]KKS77598.1 MAG: hypothetical protein UV51_C0005G0008 [Candidatus Woesebacteria bacterium GW2011_GWC1_42_9]KKS97091.1 MAG: hypothetical protein UV74_C0013G0213 [Candidatus Woesebacteria bacterium GW2011_GWB1_43_14]
MSLVALTNTQFMGLKIGDRLLLRSGNGKNRLEAEVIVADSPSASVWVIINKITLKGKDEEASVGEKRIAGRSELYLFRTRPLG